MGFLKRIFGRQAPAISQPAPVAPVYTGNPADDPNMIRVYDGYGREVFITRQDWRDKVLPGAIEQRWNDADQLYGLIYQGLKDGFIEDMVSPAQRLTELEPTAERGAVMLAVVYLQFKRWDDAERVLRQYMQEHGETGVALTNLAKVHAERGDHTLADEVLWRALQMDPNQDNGLGWYEALHRERGGEAAGRQALERVAAVAGSWRAQLWLARIELRAGHLLAALDLYRTSLDRAGQPAPVDLLMQMSGDLGNAGHLPEILDLAVPRFDPVAHGLQVGNNLIKAHLDLGHTSEAHQILEQLYAQKRPDWVQTLGYWDTEIAKAQLVKSGASTSETLRVEMCVGYGPVWLDVESSAGRLMVPEAMSDFTVTLLGGTAETGSTATQPEQQMADPPGRMSRALPLFLSEALTFQAGLHTQTLVPWVTHPAPAFMLGGTPWGDDEAAAICEKCERKSKYLITTHLLTPSDNWTLQLRLIRVADRQCLAELSQTCSMHEPEAAVQALVRDLISAMRQAETLPMHCLPDGYVVPSGARFVSYLLRLEQLLAVRLSTMDEAAKHSLNGEREIIAGNLQQCLDYPASVNARLLLARTLWYMKKTASSSVVEYRDRVELLQKEHPLGLPMHLAVQELLDQVYSG